MTDLLGFIPPGHRVSRTRLKPPSGKKSTADAVRAVQHQLLIVGPTRETTMRREVLAISRERHYLLRELLVAESAVYVTGSPLLWHPTEKLAGLDPVRLVKSLGPNLQKSNTKADHVQVRCTLCGLISREFESTEDARRWYFEAHVKQGVAHYVG